MALPTFLIHLDGQDGPITLTLSSRDGLALERAGIDMDKVKAVEGTYTVLYEGLKRQARLGKLNGTVVPETLEAFMDSADYEPVDEDAGKADTESAPPTG